VRGTDLAKDQSYVLYMLGPRELARTLLPVGELTKAAVRERATRLGLRTAAKPDSMDVCFITRGGRTQFLADRAPTPSGTIVDTAGALVGRHDGVAAFTVGQRRGLGVALGQRRYVVDVDAPSSTVTVGTRGDLLRDSVDLRDLSVTLPRALGSRPRSVLAQVRAHGEPIAAHLRGQRVRFERLQPRVAPGQVVVLYDGDTVLGGGIAT
jgi:tRNA-specific 2-thiouridylase